MNRIYKAYSIAQKTFFQDSKKYNYKYGLTWTAIFLFGSFFFENIISDILIVIALFMSPLFILIKGFWMFLISIVSPHE